MPLQQTDSLLVNRSSIDYHTAVSDVMAKVQDTDLLLVNRGNVDYKITGADFKASLGAQLINPAPADFSFTPGVTGTGTAADPFVLTPITISDPIVYGKSVEEISLTGFPVDSIMPIIEQSTGNGPRFDQITQIVDGSGEINFHFRFIDIPTTATDQTYNGEFQIGTAYFKWDVTKQMNIAPVIATTALSEDDPAGDRFTSQSFSYALTMGPEGRPISEKNIDAYVEGTMIKMAVTSDIANVETLKLRGGYNRVAAQGTTDAWNAINYGGGQFIAVGRNTTGTSGANNVMTSTDGTSWTVRPAGFPAEGNDVAYGDGKYVVATSRGIYYSTDGGDTWTQTNITSGDYCGVAYGDGTWVVINQTEARRSTDGITFSGPKALSGLTSNRTMHKVNYGNGTFIAAGVGSSQQISISTDKGRTWYANSIPNANASGGIADVAWGNVGSTSDGTWVYSAGTRNIYISTDDGSQWTPRYNTTTVSAEFGGVAFNPTPLSPSLPNGGFAVCGGRLAMLFAGDGSTNLETLRAGAALGHGIPQGPNWMDIAAGGGKFVALAPNNTMWSWTGYGEKSAIVLEREKITFTTDQSLADIDPGDAVETVETNSGGKGSGTVLSIDIASNSMVMASTNHQFQAGNHVTFPITKNARQYLQFSQASPGSTTLNVTGMASTPQAPPYLSAVNLSAGPLNLTFQFPPIFPSGNAPDDELLAGVTLNVTAIAHNIAGFSGATLDTVQPGGPSTRSALSSRSIRYMSDAEFDQQKQLMETYELREAVYQGKQAEIKLNLNQSP